MNWVSWIKKINWQWVKKRVEQNVENLYKKRYTIIDAIAESNNKPRDQEVDMLYKSVIMSEDLESPLETIVMELKLKRQTDIFDFREWRIILKKSKSSRKRTQNANTGSNV